MKKTLIAALPIVLIALLALKPAIDPLPIGSPLPKPDLKMKDITGTEVSFKDAQKKKWIAGSIQLQYLSGSKKIPNP